MKDFRVLAKIPSNEEEYEELHGALSVGWQRNWWGRFKGDRWIREKTAIAMRRGRNPEAFLLTQAVVENQIDIIAEIYHRNGNKIVRNADQKVLQQIFDARFSYSHLYQYLNTIAYLLLMQNKGLCDETLNPSSFLSARCYHRTVLEEAIFTENRLMAALIIEHCQDRQTLMKIKHVRKGSPDSPLNLAALHNQVHVVKKLLQKCDAEILNAKINGKTTLMNLVDRMIELKCDRHSRLDEIMANKDMFYLLAGNKKIDVLVQDEKGCYIIQELAEYKIDDAVIWLIENRPELIFAKDSHLNDMMMSAVLYKRYAIVECLIDKGLVNKDTKDKENGISYFNWIAIERDDCFRKILGRTIPREILTDFERLSFGKAMLRLAYSKHNFGWPHFTTLPETISSFLNIVSQPKEMEFMKSLLDVMSSNELHKVSEDKFVKVVPMHFYSHIAYVIIECDKDRVPQFVTYCDGNCILSPNPSKDSKHAMGNLTFKIDDEKLRQMGIKNDLDGITELLVKESDLKNYEKELVRNIFVNFVVCNERGNLLCTNNPLYTVPQKRGNCAFKSMNIALRDLIAKHDIEFVAEQNSQSGDNGYKVFKDFRNSLIDYALQCVLDCATHKDSILLREEARIFLQENILPKAEAKIASKTESQELLKLERHSKIKKDVEDILGIRASGVAVPTDARGLNGAKNQLQYTYV